MKKSKMKKKFISFIVITVIAFCAFLQNAVIFANQTSSSNAVSSQEVDVTPPTPTPDSAFKIASSGTGNYIWGYDVSIGGTDVVIPETINGLKVDRISDSSIFSGKGITSVYIYDGLQTIGNNAFSNNQIKSLRLPETLLTIGNNAFYNNSPLTTLSLPDSVTSLGTSAFSSCGLTSLKLSNGLTTIPMTAFSANQLSEVTIPDSVTKIEKNAFKNNLNLETVVLSEQLKTIEDFAFQLCKIENLTIKGNLETIGASAFANNNINSINLPNTLTTIGANAFKENKLTDLTIPDSVTSLGQGSFMLNSISKLSLGSGVSVIPEEVFKNNQFTSLILPDTVLEIKAMAFATNPLVAFDLPASLATLASDAFSNQMVPVTITKEDGNWYLNMNTLDETVDKTKMINITSSYGTYDENKNRIPLDRKLGKNYDAGKFNYRLKNTNIQSDTTMTVRLIVQNYNYKVQFKDSDGSIIDTQFVLEGADAQAPTNPTPPAHKEFKEWDCDFTNIQDELIVTATYQNAKQTIHFKEVDGQVITTAEARYDDYIVEPTIPTKNGYTFINWYTDTNLTTPWDFASDKVKDNMDLYAKWTPNQYSISYLNTKVGVNANPVHYTIDSSIVLKPMPDTNEYAFVGWFDSNDMNAKQITSIPKGTTGNLALYARYEYKTYAINLIDDETSDDTMMVQYKNQYGDLPIHTKKGYEFIGWFTQPNGAGIQVMKETIVEDSNPHKLYAYWKQVVYTNENGSVSFDNGQDTSDHSNRNVYFINVLISGSLIVYIKVRSKKEKKLHN